MSSTSSSSSQLRVLLAWVVISIPLGWGLYQSVIKSKPLFAGPPPAAAAPKTP